MTSDQLNVSRNAITLQDTRTDFDILLPDPSLESWDLDLTRTPTRPSKRGGRPADSGAGAHTARTADITLPQIDYGTYDDAFDVLSGGGIASQDFDPDGGLDLGLELDGDAPVGGRVDEQGRPVDENGDPVEAPGEDSLSIGVGRDAPSEAGRPSLGSILGLGAEGDITMHSEKEGGSAREGSMALPDFGLGQEEGLGGLDLGLEQDEGLDIGLEAEAPPAEAMDVDPQGAEGVGMGQRRKFVLEYLALLVFIRC